jgi:hypothetical protein
VKALPYGEHADSAIADSIELKKQSSIAVKKMIKKHPGREM